MVFFENIFIIFTYFLGVILKNNYTNMNND